MLISLHTIFYDKLKRFRFLLFCVILHNYINLCSGKLLELTGVKRHIIFFRIKIFENSHIMYQYALQFMTYIEFPHLEVDERHFMTEAAL